MQMFRACAWYLPLADGDVLRLELDGSYRAWTDNLIGYEGYGETPFLAVTSLSSRLYASDDADLRPLAGTIAGLAYFTGDIR